MFIADKGHVSCHFYGNKTATLAVFVAKIVRRFHAAPLISKALISRSEPNHTDSANYQLRILATNALDFTQAF